MTNDNIKKEFFYELIKLIKKYRSLKLNDWEIKNVLKMINIEELKTK